MSAMLRMRTTALSIALPLCAFAAFVLLAPAGASADEGCGSNQCVFDDRCYDPGACVHTGCAGPDNQYCTGPDFKKACGCGSEEL